MTNAPATVSKPCSSLRDERGYTLLEMMLVVGLMGILAAISAFQLVNMRRSMAADGAMRAIMTQLNTARERAITERRYVEVDFFGDSAIRIIRREVPAGTTVLWAIPLEGNVQFTHLPTLPDTPDGFGNDAAVSFGAADTILFGTDGSLMDAMGTPVNGTVFLAIASQPDSIRAVTVLGSVGRVRGYRWNGRAWNRV